MKRLDTKGNLIDDDDSDIQSPKVSPQKSPTLRGNKMKYEDSVSSLTPVSRRESSATSPIQVFYDFVENATMFDKENALLQVPLRFCRNVDKVFMVTQEVDLQDGEFLVGYVVQDFLYDMTIKNENSYDYASVVASTLKLRWDKIKDLVNEQKHYTMFSVKDTSNESIKEYGLYHIRNADVMKVLRIMPFYNSQVCLADGKLIMTPQCLISVGMRLAFENLGYKGDAGTKLTALNKLNDMICNNPLSARELDTFKKALPEISSKIKDKDLQKLMKDVSKLMIDRVKSAKSSCLYY